MRFPYIFYRRVNAATRPDGTSPPVLGSDTDPIDNTALKSDAVFSCKLYNVNGFPCQRIVVGFAGPVASGPLPVKCWVWDELSLAWYQAKTSAVAPSDTALRLGELMYFDTPALMDNPNTGKNQLDPTTASSPHAGPGSLDVMLVVSAAGGDPDGLYKFVVGADVSNPA